MDTRTGQQTGESARGASNGLHARRGNALIPVNLMLGGGTAGAIALTFEDTGLALGAIVCIGAVAGYLSTRPIERWMLALGSFVGVLVAAYLVAGQPDTPGPEEAVYDAAFVAAVMLFGALVGGGPAKATRPHPIEIEGQGFTSEHADGRGASPTSHVRRPTYARLGRGLLTAVFLPFYLCWVVLDAAGGYISAAVTWTWRQVVRIVEVVLRPIQLLLSLLGRGLRALVRPFIGLARRLGRVLGWIVDALRPVLRPLLSLVGRLGGTIARALAAGFARLRLAWRTVLARVFEPLRRLVATWLRRLGHALALVARAARRTVTWVWRTLLRPVVAPIWRAVVAAARLIRRFAAVAWHDAVRVSRWVWSHGPRQLAHATRQAGADARAMLAGLFSPPAR